MLEKQISCMEDELSETRLEASRLKAELVSEKSASHVKVSELQSRINEVIMNYICYLEIINFKICFYHYLLFVMIAVGRRAVAHQRTLEDSRIKSAYGIGLAERERRTSKVTARNCNVSARFATDAIRGND